jgi:predicted metalloprotease
MEYDNMPSSSNIEDRRGQRGGAVGAGGLGIGAIVVIFAISYFTGISPQVLISGAEMMGVGQQSAPPQTAPVDPNDPTRKFLSKVVGGTEAVWTEVLPAQTGVQYQPATLVIYDGATRSGCGGAQAAMGPFYCPIDKKVYLDTSFFRDMQTKFGGGGDFAYAYVVAHEIGHHVQDLLGILDQGRAAGRLPGRRVGQSRQRQMEGPSAGRRRKGAGDRASNRRRSAADRVAGLRGA